MLSWKDLLDLYMVRHHDAIAKLTKPLWDRFGINYFTYHRIDEKGNYMALTDRPDLVERYIADGIYRGCPSTRHPSAYQSGLLVLNELGSDRQRSLIRRLGKETLGSDTGVVLVAKRERNAVEFIGFAGPLSLALNDLPILNAFGAHFKKEMGSVLRQLEEEPGYLPDLKGDDYWDPTPLVPSCKDTAFFQKIGLEKVMYRASQLSPQERACLSSLIEDKTAKEIALELGLSPRTVESYLESIKLKWSCWNKKELITIGRELHSFGVLYTETS